VAATSVTTYLWFDNQALEAAAFYAAPVSAVVNLSENIRLNPYHTTEVVAPFARPSVRTPRLTRSSDISFHTAFSRK